MATRFWYVTPDRSKVNWGTAVSGGVATTRIYEIKDTDGTGNDEMRLFAAQSQPVSAQRLQLAQMRESTDPIPPRYVPPKAGGGSTFALKSTDVEHDTRLDTLENDLALKGEPGGLAALDGSGQVPDAQIPAVVARTSAVTAEIATAISDLVASSPATLDTLNELATALGNDPNFATTVTNSLAGKAPLRMTETAVAGTTYVLALADEGRVVACSSASAVTVTVPANATVALPVGSMIEVFQYGAGQVTLAAETGVTLLAPNGLRLAYQYGSAVLRKRATNEWVLNGEVVP